MKEVTKVVFLLNIMKVGDRACYYASNLVVVDIPEGITIIGDGSFEGCSSLKDIKFPKSLTSIGDGTFANCSSLEQVDLLHTNVHELGDGAFAFCESLREMKVPDSLQTFGNHVFHECSELVPSDIDIYDCEAVVAYLRSIQSDDAEDSSIEVEEVTINGTTYIVEVGGDDEERAIFNVTEDSDDELGDEIGFMLNGEAEFE